MIIFHSQEITPPGSLESRARLIPVGGRPGCLDWAEILDVLARDRIMGLLVEGGGQVAASALRAGAVQKVSFFYAPKIVGSDGTPGIAHLEITQLSRCLQLQRTRMRRLGSDFVIEGYLD